MIKYLNLRTNIALGLIIAFLANTFGPLPAQAQDFYLPAPGMMVHLSPEFEPPILKGIKVHPDNPFRFDFILDRGDSQFSNEALKDESSKLIKYFLASLTIPEKDLWVNLSPYEKDRIIPNSFGLTSMGRDLLAEDYMLKQITASLIYPEDEIGKRFWKRIYEEAFKRYGTTNIPVNTFNKVWIVPEKAVVYENAKAGTAYVVESKLKVMLEQDYLSMSKHVAVRTDVASVGTNIVREIVIPELTKEVNDGKNFAQLRQVYNSLILATWYKKKIKDSILEQVYADKNKVAGVNIDDPQEKERIYQRYLQAFKKGVYNYIKDDVDTSTQETMPRKYFSGGEFLALSIKDEGNTSFVGEPLEVIHNFPKGKEFKENGRNLAMITVDAATASNPGNIIHVGKRNYTHLVLRRIITGFNRMILPQGAVLLTDLKPRDVPNSIYNKKIIETAGGELRATNVLAEEIRPTTFLTIDHVFGLMQRIEKLDRERTDKNEPIVILDWGCGSGTALVGLLHELQSREREGRGIANVILYGFSDEFYLEWKQAPAGINFIWGTPDHLKKYLYQHLHKVSYIYSHFGLENILGDQYFEKDILKKHLWDLHDLLDPKNGVLLVADTPGQEEGIRYYQINFNMFKVTMNESLSSGSIILHPSVWEPVDFAMTTIISGAADRAKRVVMNVNAQRAGQGRTKNIINEFVNGHGRITIAANDGAKFVYQFMEIPRNGFEITVKNEEGRIVGFVDVANWNTVGLSFGYRLRDMNDDWDAIMVIEEYREKYSGIGQSLMRLAMEVAKSKRERVFYISGSRVDPFYDKLGFISDGLGKFRFNLNLPLPGIHIKLKIGGPVQATRSEPSRAMNAGNNVESVAGDRAMTEFNKTLYPTLARNGVELIGASEREGSSLPMGLGQAVISETDGSITSSVHPDEFLIVNSNVHPDVKIETKYASSCTVVAVKAKRGNEIFYGLAHVYNIQGRNETSLIEQIRYLRNEIIKKAGVSDKNIEYIIAYRAREYKENPDDAESLIKKEFGSVFHFHQRDGSEIENALVTKNAIIINSTIFPGNKLPVTYPWSNDNAQLAAGAGDLAMKAREHRTAKIQGSADLRKNHEANLADAERLKKEIEPSLNDISTRFDKLEALFLSTEPGEVRVPADPFDLLREIITDLGVLEGFQSKIGHSIKVTMSSFLQLYIEHSELPQTAIANITGISPQYLSQIKNMKTHGVPTEDTRKKFLYLDGINEEEVTLFDHLGDSVDSNYERGKRLFINLILLIIDAYGINFKDPKLGNSGWLLRDYNEYVSIAKMKANIIIIEELSKNKSLSPVIRMVQQEELWSLRRKLAIRVGQLLREWRGKRSLVNVYTDPHLIELLREKHAGLQDHELGMLEKGNLTTFPENMIVALAQYYGKEIASFDDLEFDPKVRSIRGRIRQDRIEIKNNYKTIRQRLIALLSQKGISQAGLSRALQLNKMSVTYWKEGSVNVGLQYVPLIAQQFSVQSEDLGIDKKQYRFYFFEGSKAKAKEKANDVMTAREEKEAGGASRAMKSGDHPTVGQVELVQQVLAIQGVNKISRINFVSSRKPTKKVPSYDHYYLLSGDRSIQGVVLESLSRRAQQEPADTVFKFELDLRSGVITIRSVPALAVDEAMVNDPYVDYLKELNPQLSTFSGLPEISGLYIQSSTGPLRYPGLYDLLLSYTNEDKEKPLKVALMGPGLKGDEKEGYGSPQLFETMGVLGLKYPNRPIEFSVISNRSKELSELSQIRYYTYNFRSLYALSESVRFLLKRFFRVDALQDGQKYKINIPENVDVRSFLADFKTMNYGENLLDLMIGTFSLKYAFMGRNISENTDLFVKWVKALRTGGKLLIDLGTLNYVIPELNNLVNSQNIITPALFGSQNTLPDALNRFEQMLYERYGVSIRINFYQDMVEVIRLPEAKVLKPTDNLGQRMYHLTKDGLELGDQAMNGNNTGGIDLTPANKVLQTQNTGESIKFHLNPAQLAQLQNAPGFVPVIISIQPMTNLREFLGLDQSTQSNVG